MKKLLVSLAALAAAAFACPAQAQQFPGTAVTQTPQRADVATTVGTAGCAAVNATQAAGTLTITPPAGNFVVFTWISIDFVQDGTGQTATNLSFTSTNLSGSPIWEFGHPLGTNVAGSIAKDVYPTGLKSTTAGTAVTIVPPAQQTHDAYCVRAAYYIAPGP